MKKITLACLLMLAIFSCTKQDKPTTSQQPDKTNGAAIQLTMDKAENIRRATALLEASELPADKKREMIEDIVAMVNYGAKPPANAKLATADDDPPVSCIPPKYANGYTFNNLSAPPGLLFNVNACMFDYPANCPPDATPCAARVLNKPMGTWQSTIVAYHLTVSYTSGQSVYTGAGGCGTN